MARPNIVTLRATLTDAGARTFRAVCSTDRVNTYGYQIDQAGWNLERFVDVGPVLLEHGAAESLFGGHDPGLALPIGSARNVRVEGGALRAEITIASDEAHPLGDRVVAAIREKTLTGISVGCVVDEWNEDETVALACTLMEISVCAVQADAGARIELSARRRAAARARRDPRTASVFNPIQHCASAKPGERFAPVGQTDGAVYGAMTPAERHELAQRDPAAFARAHDAHHEGPYTPPSKPYDALTFGEKHTMLRRAPEHFARLQAAHRGQR